MRHEFKKISAVLLSTVLGMSLLAGGSFAETSGKSEGAGAGEVTAEEKTLQEETMETQAESDDSNEFDLPTLGLTVAIPDALMESMNQRQVIMFTNEIPVEDFSALEYGYLSWKTAGEILDVEEINMDEMQSVGVLGVYHAELADSLDELTGCDEHQEVGQSADGVYQYYLSVNTSADEELVKEVREVKAIITEMADYEAYYGGMGAGMDAGVDDGTDAGMDGGMAAGTSGGTAAGAGDGAAAGMDDGAAADQPSGSTAGSVGEFSTQDVNGDTVTQDIFKDYKLTMVNIFTTWCSPCVAEMPDLEQLYQQMKDRNVGVVGVVLDVLNEKGEIVEEDLERAQLLVQKTGVTYPVILPDSTYFNGRLTSIEAFPESFFVDQDGNIVGETYSGSGSLEDWLETVEKELANLEAGA